MQMTEKMIKNYLEHHFEPNPNDDVKTQPQYGTSFRRRVSGLPVRNANQPASAGGCLVNEILCGWACVGARAQVIEDGMLRRAAQLGLLVTEQAVRPDYHVCLLHPAGHTGSERVASVAPRLLAWCGHVVGPELPLWPSAADFLQSLADASAPRLAALDGLFALALLDERTRSLVLAADPFGMQPLYFARCGKGLVFSSSADLILRSLPGPITLNPTAAAEYLHFHYCLGDKTLANEVERLPQGCALTLHLDEGRVQCDRL